jgi:hypothetical protein
MPTKDTQQMSSSDFNMQKLNTKDLSEHLASTIKMGGNITIFGRRGSGKTLISREVIKKSECGEVYLNLSVLERVDLGGYPDVMASQKKDDYVSFMLPSFFKPMIEGNKKVVLLLDELDKADPSLWAPLLEITQFRHINGRPLKNLQAIIATGNLISEGGSRPSLPLLDRAEKYLVEADVASWLDWAGKSGSIHPAVSAYINDHPKDLFGAVDPEDRYADPSPRGWHRASEILFKGEKMGWNAQLLNMKVSGCVGKDAGLKYQNYYEHYMDLLPMVKNIFDGKDVSKVYNKLERTKQIVACMIACARLANELDNVKDPKNLPKTVDHVGKFLSQASYENVLVSVRSQIQIERLVKFELDSHAEWSGVLGKISKEVDQ